MERLDDPSVRVLDGRSMWGVGEPGYLEGHIPGAVYVDVGNDLTDAHGGVPGLIPPKSEFVVQALNDIGSVMGVC